MDKTSQKNLSPELKAVYDRVMNTKISARPTPASPNPATKPQSAPEHTAPPPSASAKPILQTEVISEPPTPQIQSEPEPTMQVASEPTGPTAPTPEPQASIAPDLSPIEPATQESSGGTFLSSLPPRPLNSMSDQPFVFTGGKSSTPEQQKDGDKNNTKAEESPKPQKSESKISSKIIMGLLVVFLLVYSLFWAKIFNIF